MIGVRRLFLSMLMLAFAPVSALAGSPPAVTAADRFIGRADAPVTVVEYASFSCSHCADWHLVVYPEFKRRFIDTGQVRLVFRNLPTAPASIAVPAAALARCAAPERFYEVAGTLMRGQSAVLNGGDQTLWFDSAVAVSGRTKSRNRRLRRPARDPGGDRGRHRRGHRCGRGQHADPVRQRPAGHGPQPGRSGRDDHAARRRTLSRGSREP